MVYRFKKFNAYPVLCMNGCKIENIKYNDSYLNLVLKEGFIKKTNGRTRDAMLSVEGGDEVVKIYLTEVLPKENQSPFYRTRELDVDEFIKMLSKGEAVIQEEYNSANRVLLLGEI